MSNREYVVWSMAFIVAVMVGAWIGFSGEPVFAPDEHIHEFRQNIADLQNRVYELENRE